MSYARLYPISTELEPVSWFASAATCVSICVSIGSVFADAICHAWQWAVALFFLSLISVIIAERARVVNRRAKRMAKAGGSNLGRVRPGRDAETYRRSSHHFPVSALVGTNALDLSLLLHLLQIPFNPSATEPGFGCNLHLRDARFRAEQL